MPFLQDVCFILGFFLDYNDINSTASYGSLFHYLLFRKLPCSQCLISVILALVKYLTHYSFPLVSVDYCYVPTLLFSFPNSLMLLTHICYPLLLPDPFLKKQLTDFFSTSNWLFNYLNYVNYLLVAVT